MIWDAETVGCSPSLSSIPVRDQRWEGWEGREVGKMGGWDGGRMEGYDGGRMEGWDGRLKEVDAQGTGGMGGKITGPPPPSPSPPPILSSSSPHPPPLLSSSRSPRLFVDAMAEIASWLKAPENAHEFLILYLDNQNNLARWKKVRRHERNGGEGGERERRGGYLIPSNLFCPPLCQNKIPLVLSSLLFSHTQATFPPSPSPLAPAQVAAMREQLLLHFDGLTFTPAEAQRASEQLGHPPTLDQILETGKRVLVWSGTDFGEEMGDFMWSRCVCACV